MRERERRESRNGGRRQGLGAFGTEEFHLSEALPSGSTTADSQRGLSKKVISREEDLRPYSPAYVQRGRTAASRRCPEVEVIKA